MQNKSSRSLHRGTWLQPLMYRTKRQFFDRGCLCLNNLPKSISHFPCFINQTFFNLLVLGRGVSMSLCKGWRHAGSSVTQAILFIYSIMLAITCSAFSSFYQFPIYSFADFQMLEVCHLLIFHLHSAHTHTVHVLPGQRCQAMPSA